MSEIDALAIEAVLTDIQGEQKKITSVKSLATLIEAEQLFWRDEGKAQWRYEPITQITGKLDQIIHEINSFRSSYGNWDENQKKQQLNSLTARTVDYVRQITFSKTPLTAALVETCRLGQAQAQSFWNYVTKQGNGQLPSTNFGHVEGAIRAYEFIFQGESAIIKRRESEKHALAALRKSLSDKTDELITETDSFQAEIRSKANEFIDSVEKWRTSTETSLQEKIDADIGEREQFFEDASSRLSAMETLYKEKLKLEGPADYWQKRARAFKISGRCWGGALVFTTISVGGVFSWLFYEWLSSGKVIEKFSAQHWQGVILLGAVLSMFIFLIRTFGKMTFSSFHLQRDAEEREQLAYLYLALNKETEFGEESRKIVLQSLFSRSETGLLSGEHGPTMPISDVAKQLNQASGR